MISIIIVNFYSEKLVKKCIESIYRNKTPFEIEVIIVDNGSNTNILDSLVSQNIKILKNEINRGFAAACNMGASSAEYELLLFLNPDTRLYDDTLKSAVELFKDNSDIDVLGCKQINEFNEVHRSCARYMTLSRYFNKLFGLNKLFPKVFKTYHMHDWDHLTSRYVDHVIGAFYLLSSANFKLVGGFDEDYFVYYEDLDLSRKITNKGGKIFYSSEIEIFHQGGGASQQFMARRLFYSLDSVLTYGSKHFTKFNFFILRGVVLYVEPVIRITAAFCFLHFKKVKEIKHAYNMLYEKRL